MHPKQINEIYQEMSSYVRKGKKSAYKKKQMNRLITILEDIIKNEPICNLNAIGRKQIIGYYKRRQQESYKTLNEKYQILNKYMTVKNPQVKVPKPDPNKCNQD